MTLSTIFNRSGKAAPSGVTSKMMLFLMISPMDPLLESAMNFYKKWATITVV